MTLLKNTVFVSTITLFATPVWGQAAFVPDDEIIITGTRFPTTIDEAITAVSVITAEDIELGQFRLLSEALKQVPGVQITRSGSFGGVTTTSIRGLPSELTKVVIDGIDQNDPSTFENTSNIATVDTADIERIEILRGPQSTLYGSDAIGGVINIVTRPAQQGLEGRASIEAGSFGAVRGNATLRGGWETLSTATTISAGRIAGISSAEKANGNSERDGSRDLTVSSKVRITPFEDISLDGVFRYRDTRVEFDDFDFFLGPIDGDNVSNTQEIFSAAFLNIGQLESLFQHRLSFTYALTERQDLATFAFDGEGERLSYEYQAHYRPIQELELIAGAERQIDKSRVVLGFGTTDQITITSGFGLVQFEPLEWSHLSVGIRHDANSRFGGETTFSGGGWIRLSENAKLRGAYQEGFRAPTTNELAFNPILRPEKSTGWDISLEGGVWRDRITLIATYFRQDIKELISFDPFLFIPVNLESFQSQGVELAINAELFEGLDVKGAYTYTDAENVSQNSRALRQPRHRANLTLSYFPTDDWALSTNVFFNGREVDFGQIGVDAFVTLGLKASYRLNERWEIYGRIENATDSDYQDIAGFGTAGLSTFAGIRVEL